MDIAAQHVMQPAMSSTIKISISKDFSEFPAGREADDGPNSGERFRDEILAPLLLKPDTTIEVDFDGTMGFGSSFLEEAFGGLVRKYNFVYDDLRKRIVIHDSRVMYEHLVWEYVKEESIRVFGR